MSDWQSRPYLQSTTSAHVTISVGCATQHPDQEHGPIETLILRADQALYQAKHLGRNRVQSA